MGQCFAVLDNKIHPIQDFLNNCDRICHYAVLS